MNQNGTLVREAKKAGFTVERTNGGHVKFTGPTGDVVIDSSTPSDHRAAKNTRARLKQAGLGRTPDQPDERLVRAEENTAKVGIEVRVLEYLQSRHDEDVSVAEIQEALGLFKDPVKNAVQRLRGKYPQIVKSDSGFSWSEIMAQPVGEISSLPEPAPAPSTPRRGLSLDVYDLLKNGGGQELTVREIAKHCRSKVANVSATISVLRKNKPEIVQTRRGVYAYRPKVLSEKDHARARIRLVERDLKDASPMSRSLLMAERDRLQAVIDTPEQVEEPPVEVSVPAQPFKPITVMPTALPEACPGMFEAVTTCNPGSLVLRDENGNLWVARPLQIDVVSVAFGNI